MNMNRLSFLIVFCFVAGTAVAEDRAADTTSATLDAIPPLPTQLSGRWYNSAGARFSSTWEVKQISNGSGLVTWWGFLCSFQNVLMDIEYDGDVLKISATKEQLAKTSCSFKFVATLKRSGNKFEGDIEHEVSQAGFTVFHTTVE